MNRMFKVETPQDGTVEVQGKGAQIHEGALLIFSEASAQPGSVVAVFRDGAWFSVTSEWLTKEEAK